MKLRAAARVTAIAVLLSLCTRGVWADAIVAAGRRFDSRARFVTAGDEVLAPLLPALGALGARCEVGPDAIKITTSAQQEILISRTRPEATRDGVLRELPCPPRVKDGSVLLPAKAVGSLLGCAVRWDEPSRTLFVHPWVRKFSLDTLPDRYRLTVATEGPISYQSGRVEEGTPRLFLDLLDADLSDIPSEVTLEGSYLQRARIRQKSLAPAQARDVVRVVVELAEWRSYRIRLGEGRRTLEVDFPLPGEREVPPEAPPVVLSGLTFGRLSPRLAAVTVSTSGKAVYTSGASAEPPAVWLEVRNAENRIAAGRLEVKDKVVSGVTVAPSPTSPGSQRLTIALTAPTGHTVISERGELRVLVGQFELNELCLVVDPGHGGPDTGAIGRSGLMEKDFNLDVALRVSRLLEAMGAKVRLTRSDDSACIPWTRGNRQEHRAELEARCSLANQAGADLFVSIHANARETNPQSVRGTETYYRKEDSRAFAQVMQEEVVRAAGLPDGGAKYHPRPIIVLYRTTVPAVLVEVGYLSNTADERSLADSDFREQAAYGIVNGIKRWVTEGGLLAQLAARESRPAPE